jgi:hypothetical protein
MGNWCSWSPCARALPAKRATVRMSVSMIASCAIRLLGEEEVEEGRLYEGTVLARLHVSEDRLLLASVV